MNAIDPKILEFISEHHVLTLATSVESQPYVANCFYVFDTENSCFYFTSDPKTRHGVEIQANANVAASIVLETKIIGKIQGLQIVGTAQKIDSSEDSRAKFKYLSAFPYAILNLETMWKLEATFLKFTDNRLGFGKKILWNRG